MAIILEILHQRQTHHVEVDSMLDHAAFDSAVKKVLPNCRMEEYTAKYTDDEDDLCTLVEPTFADFLTMGKGTPGGKVIFCVQVEASPARLAQQHPATPPPPQLPCRITNRRQQMQQRTPTSVWVDDCRDLDQLLLLFDDDEVVASPKQSRRKKKVRKVLSRKEQIHEDGDGKIVGEDVEKVEREECERDSREQEQQYQRQQDSQSELCTPSGIVTVNLDAQPEALASEILEETVVHQNETSNTELTEQDEVASLVQNKCVQETHQIFQKVCAKTNYHCMIVPSVEECQTGTDQWETDDETCWEMGTVDTQLAERSESEVEVEADSSGGTLQRARSCPCIPTWHGAQIQSDGEACSLVEQAWPFVDTNQSFANPSGSLATQDLAGQVVWMPVYINWWAPET